MKIALEMQPLIKDRSGIGWYTYEITKRLGVMGENYIGYVFNFLNRNDLDSLLSTFALKNEINTWFPYRIYRLIWNYIPVKYNSLFKTESDIYHFFNFVVPPYIDGKVIVNIYDMVYKSFPETMTVSNFKRLEKNLKRSANRADMIITISENSKNEIIKYLNIDLNKIRIVPPGIDLEVYDKEYNKEEILKIRKKYSLPDSYILYLGTLEPRKNIPTLIKAFSEYKKNTDDSIKLVIAGGKGWMYESIFNLANHLNLSDKIIFTGYIDEADKVLIYKLSEMFIFPSVYEGFGMPVLEAMAAGVPVITSNCSSMPEVVGDAALLVEPKDEHAIFLAMKSLRSNNSLRGILIENGREQCKKYTWDKSIEKLMCIYSELGGRI